MARQSATAVTPSAKPPARRKRRPRNSLDVEEIIGGAFELAEAVSLSGLSVPMLARHLDVPITSIYWHFRKKADLLDAMTERASREYFFSMPFVSVDTWQEGLRQHFFAMRQVFHDKPVLVELVLMRTGDLDAEAMQDSLNSLEAAIRTLVEAGFTPEEALDLYMTLSVHIRGVAVLEHLDTAVTTRDISRIPSAEHSPLLHQLALQGHLSGSITDTTFAATVDAVITQAEQLLAARRPKPARKKAARK